MRFKASIADPRALYRVAHAIDRVAKVCVVKLSPTSVRFIVKDDAAASGLQVWSRLGVDVWSQVIIDSKANNEIHLECPLPHLVRALRSTLNAHSATLKLTKTPGSGPSPPAVPGAGAGTRGIAAVLLLTVESDAPRVGHPLKVDQHIPCTVLNAAAARELVEPRMPSPEVLIALPRPLGDVKTVVERMKGVAGNVTLAANNAGTFVMACTAGAGEVRVEANGLERPQAVLAGRRDAQQQAQPGVPARDPEELVGVTVGAKDLARFLQCHVANPVSVVFCVHRDLCAVFYVNLTHDEAGGEVGAAGGQTLTYWIPAKLE